MLAGRRLRPRRAHGRHARAEPVALHDRARCSSSVSGPSATARTDQVKATIAAGVPFAIGSDGALNPFLNIMFAAMNPANPSQALTVEQAVAAYTRGSAAAELAERQKGTIAPGMLADVALLSQDIFKVPLDQLPRTTSVLTIVNGRIVHEAK